MLKAVRRELARASAIRHDLRGAQIFGAEPRDHDSSTHEHDVSHVHHAIVLTAAKALEKRTPDASGAFGASVKDVDTEGYAHQNGGTVTIGDFAENQGFNYHM
jgi:hypothetical protein